MKSWHTCLVLATACGWLPAAAAQLQLLANDRPQCVFAGGQRAIAVTFSNAGEKTFEAPVRARILQTTSATVVQLGDRPWKKIEVLPQQTVLESAPVDFPAVTAVTKFLVQWLAETNELIGSTEVLVYPTNLLAELKPMTGSEGPGVFDPENQLKPLLKDRKLEFTDLEDAGFQYFTGNLAIVGPFDSAAQMPPGLKEQIKTLAKKGTAVVWLLPPAEERPVPVPSFYYVAENTNEVVVVQADQVSGLAGNPQAQLNLICFCKLALNPVPLPLPDMPPQP